MNQKSPRNKTIEPFEEDIQYFEQHSVYKEPTGSLHACDWEKLSLPPNSIDLLIADPPYNMDKDFQGFSFKKQSEADHIRYTEKWISAIIPALKETASIYICCDWKNSAVIYQVIAKYFNVLNRITWEREKGRGALQNWKNTSEDIWFASCGKNYTFNAEAVKIRKKVIAPYTNAEGEAKDWKEEKGEKYRLTSASNLWTDLTVPYWSMPENTPHPTQKPEKLLAKLILASSNEGDTIFDPFCGSGTTLVTAKKLNRHFIGSEINPYYTAVARRRLILAETDKRIQGYDDGIFKDRNSR
ncbi:MAG: DNA-methyltransferase [Brevinema sp.]